MRIIGIDRPGIGTLTPHLYGSVLEFTDDLVELADVLGIDRMRLIGLSGGGPYVLAAGAALKDRVEAVAVLGGVAPTKGPDAVEGGLVSLGARFAPVISVGRIPIEVAFTTIFRFVHPFASPGLDLYARCSRTATGSFSGGRRSRRCSSTTCSTGAASN